MASRGELVVPLVLIGLAIAGAVATNHWRNTGGMFDTRLPGGGRSDPASQRADGEHYLTLGYQYLEIQKTSEAREAFQKAVPLLEGTFAREATDSQIFGLLGHAYQGTAEVAADKAAWQAKAAPLLAAFAGLHGVEDLTDELKTTASSDSLLVTQAAVMQGYRDSGRGRLDPARTEFDAAITSLAPRTRAATEAAVVELDAYALEGAAEVTSGPAHAQRIAQLDATLQAAEHRFAKDATVKDLSETLTKKWSLAREPR